jgi:hypothetical protein
LKRFVTLFELTVQEQRTIVVLLLVIAAILVAKTYREQANEKRQPQSSAAQPSPSPGTRP